MVLPLIVRAAPFLARGVSALKKGKKLKDMGMADVVDAPILRIAGEAAKKSKGTSVASKAATAAVVAAALADAASTPKPKPKAKAKGRRGGVAPSGSTARENATPKITPKAAAPNAKAAAPKAAASGKKGLSSFGSAFAAARAKGESVFEFNGKKYNTMQKGETKEQHKAALAKSKLKPLKKLETQADVDKRRLKQKALQEKARKETGKKK